MTLNRFVAVFALAVAVSRPAMSQGVNPVVSQPSDAAAHMRQETRAALIAAAEETQVLAARESNRERKHMLQEKAQRLRERLESGDLRVGDKVLIDVINPPEMLIADTLQVRAGQMLPLTGLSIEIPLRGILRSELTDHITTHLKKDFRNPQIRTRTMIGIYVTGQVQGAGSRSVTQDALLRDVVTDKGTITSEANIDKVTVLRHGKVLYGPDTMRVALDDGRTIEDMQIVGGDEIQVGKIRRTNWFNVLQMVSSTVGIVLGLYSIMR